MADTMAPPEAELEAVRQWRYEPSTLRGRRVPIILTVTLDFRLQS